MHGARLAATEEDLLLASLLDQAKLATPPRRGVNLFGQPARSTPSLNRVQRAIADDQLVLVAGTIDDVAVGVALARVNQELVSIEELYVEPDAREVGVGEAMLEFVVDWGREKSATAVDYPAIPGDRASKNLGERAGFSARVIVMHRSI